MDVGEDACDEKHSSLSLHYENARKMQLADLLSRVDAPKNVDVKSEKKTRGKQSDKTDVLHDEDQRYSSNLQPSPVTVRRSARNKSR